MKYMKIFILLVLFLFIGCIGKVFNEPYSVPEVKVEDYDLEFPGLKNYSFVNVGFAQEQSDKYWFEIIVPFILEDCDVVAFTFLPSQVTSVSITGIATEEFSNPLEINKTLDEYLFKVEDLNINLYEHSLNKRGGKVSEYELNMLEQFKGKYRRVLIKYYNIEGRIKEIIETSTLDDFSGLYTGPEELEGFEDPACFKDGLLKMKTISHEGMAEFYLTKEEARELLEKSLPLNDRLESSRETLKKMTEEQRKEVEALGITSEDIENEPTEITIEEYKNVIYVPFFLGFLNI